jgi:NAD(P)-dependent dehydrogenase (short-subunit alcohol dehydrogenase family)
VTQAFLPLLRQAPGRLVVIGSIGDRISMPFGEPLSASKSAIASMTDAFRQELAPWGIRVVLVEPASIHTEAVDKVERDARGVVDAFPPDGRKLYQDAYQSMVRAAIAREREGSPPGLVADTIAEALTTGRPRSRYLVGKNSRLLATLAAVLPVPALDALRRRLFGLPAPGSRAVRTRTRRGTVPVPRPQPPTVQGGTS